MQGVVDRQILYVAPSLPYPLTSGQALRHFHVLRAYAAVGRVKLVYLYWDDAQLEAAMALRPYCESLHPVPGSTVARPLSDEVAPLWRRRLELAATVRPSITSGFASRELKRVVDSLVPSIDLVHVAKLWMMPNADAAIRRRRGSAPAVLDLDDVETEVKKRMLAVDPPARWQRRLFEGYDMVRLSLYQRRALRFFDRIFVCSQRDQVRLHRANVEVIPNGTTIPSGLLPEESDGRTLLSVGSLAYPPNVDGLLFFVREVLPLIRREVRGVRLLIVGSGMPGEIRRLDDGDRICVYASVPTVEPYYRQATAAVVSLRIGGGTRVRILEAFALGRAVVSTSVGSEGLEVINGEHLLVGDEPPDFAASCVALLREPALRRRLVARSRQLVEQKYAWGPIEDRVKAVAAELLLERRR